jgi:hypothetical protein
LEHVRKTFPHGLCGKLAKDGNILTVWLGQIDIFDLIQHKANL